MKDRIRAATPDYRGSSKHKNRPPGGLKGTLCPEWTHINPFGGLATDMHTHDWTQTRAGALFSGAQIDQVSGRRYATAEGIAFEARPTADGSWHGFPVPWESVPVAIKKDWLEAAAVKKSDVRKFFRFDRDDIGWAMQTDPR